MNLIKQALATEYFTGETPTEGFIPFTEVGQIIASVLQLVFFLAGILAFAFLILGGIEYITSGGEKDKVQGAQQKLTYAILGLVIIVAVYAIVRILEALFGIPILTGFTFRTVPGVTPIGQ